MNELNSLYCNVAVVYFLCNTIEVIYESNKRLFARLENRFG